MKYKKVYGLLSEKRGKMNLRYATKQCKMCISTKECFLEALALINQTIVRLLQAELLQKLIIAPNDVKYLHQESGNSYSLK